MNIPSAEHLALILIRDHIRPIHTPVQLYVDEMIEDTAYDRPYREFCEEQIEQAAGGDDTSWSKMSGCLFDRVIGAEDLEKDLAGIVTEEEIDELSNIGIGICEPESDEEFGRPDAVPLCYSSRHEIDRQIVQICELIGDSRSYRATTGECGFRTDPENLATLLGAIFRAIDESLAQVESSEFDSLVDGWWRLTARGRATMSDPSIAA